MSKQSILVALVLFFIAFGKLYLQAMSSGCYIKVLDFVGMYLRKVPARVIVNVMVTGTKAGLPVGLQIVAPRHRDDRALRRNPAVLASSIASDLARDLRAEQEAAPEN